jgi:hypothetical protein
VIPIMTYRTATVCALGLFLLLAGDPAAGQGAIVNARIHTMNPEQPHAAAMAWDAEGRITFIGDLHGFESRFPERAARDLQGRSVLPGLIDAHGHVMGLGMARLQADLVGADSLAAIVDRLEAQARDLPEGAWLTGRGWDHTLWGNEFPDAGDLDEAFPDRPVWLERVDGHAGWANSAALARATRDLSGDWQPQGGKIHRDENGRPTGILIDTAMRFVADSVPEPDESVRARALSLALEELNRVGLTGVHDMGVSRADFELYRRAAAAGELSVRIVAFADGDAEMLAWLCDNGYWESPRLKARSVKFYADGALGSRGAALLDDYSDDPGNSGLLFHDDEALGELVDRAMDCGLQLGIHAIGDAANRQVIDALVARQAAHPDNPGRHRVEHVQVIDPVDMPRLAEHDLIASMQPMHATSDMRWAADRLGAERLEGAYAWSTLAELGVHLALGSDFPVEPADPWLGIHAAVTRQRDGLPPGGWRPREALSVEQALRGFTIDAARAGFSEGRVGSLAAGKQADFVVVDADPFEIEASALETIDVVQTVVGGQTVFEKAN